MIHLFLHVMIYESPEQKVDGKHIILTYESMRKQKVYSITQIPPILRLKAIEIFHTKLCDPTVYYKFPNQAIASASDYIEGAKRNNRIFMLVMQCRAFIQYFYDV